MTADNTEKKDQVNTTIDELRTMLSQAHDTLAQLNNAKDNINTNIVEASNQLTELKTKQQSVSEQLAALETQRRDMQGLVSALNTLKAEAEANKNSVTNDVQVITQTKAQFEDLRNQSQTARDDLTNKQAELTAKISEINSAYDRITQQQKALFDDSTDQSGNAIRAVVSQIHDSNTAIKNLLADAKRGSEATATEIGAQMDETETKISALTQETESKLKGVIDQSTIDITELKKRLEQDIRSLLPEAGAAGLASTFFEAKSKYAITSIEPKADTISMRRFLKAWHYFISALTPLFFYAMFILPLLGIVFIFYDVIKIIGTAAPPADGSIHVDPTMLLFRFMLSLPLAAISAFGWSSIRLYRRLYEEYNHKQRVMQLYHSFKDEIGDSEEHKNALLAIMLSAVGDKPSLAMHHYDKNIGDIGIGIGDIIGKLMGKGKSD